MIQVFVDRKYEMEVLEKEWKRNRASFAIIYGRRRVGKTEIVRKFLQGKRGVYYLADRRDDKSNRADFQRAVEDSGIKDFSLYRFDDWVLLFKKLCEEVRNERYAVVIDEFPYLVRESTLSQFQKAWDLYIKNSRIFLILVGSSISMMERLTLDYSSPLYGRRTMQLRVEKMQFWDAWKFLPDYDFYDFLRIFAVTDGIPHYILQMNPSLSWRENIKRNVLSKDKILYEEAEFLLRMELREFTHYYPILEAIARGKRKFGEIRDYTGIEPATLSKYLKNLREIGVVRENSPIFGRERNKRYILGDNYFSFYFGFIKPYRRYLEIEEVDAAWNKMKDSFNTYVGRILEDVIRKYLEKKYPGMEIGAWWNRKGQEIDIIGINRESKEAFVGEVKLNKELGKRELKKLRELSRDINELKKYRVRYILIAPKIRVVDEDVIALTINDIARDMKKL